MDPAVGPASRLRSRVALAAAGALATALAAAALAAVVPERLAADLALAGARDGYGGIRLLRDDWDRDVYARIGAWSAREGALPYRDVRSEYPQLATYFFALPYAASGDTEGYRVAFSLLMAILLGATALVLATSCRRFGRDPARAWLLVLPATLYFSLYRFDLLAALLSLSSFALLFAGRPRSACALLAVAVLVKVYPVVYLPLALLWCARQEGHGEALRCAGVFAGVLALCSLQLALWVSWDAPLRAVVHQASRMDNGESLYHFAREAFPWLGETAGRRLFQALQLSPLVLAPWWRPRSAEALLRLATAVTITMALFSRFQSPQWIVWITPLAILACRPRELALVVAADLATYLYFPLAWDVFGTDAAPFVAALGLCLATRAALLACLLRPATQPRLPNTSSIAPRFDFTRSGGTPTPGA